MVCLLPLCFHTEVSKNTGSSIDKIVTIPIHSSSYNFVYFLHFFLKAFTSFIPAENVQISQTCLKFLSC